MSMKIQLLKFFKEGFKMDIDPWGHTMDWFFTIAHLLYCTYGKTPEHWEYRPGGFGSKEIDEDEYELIYLYDLKYISEEDLVFFGNCLNRIETQLKKMGRDY